MGSDVSVLVGWETHVFPSPGSAGLRTVWLEVSGDWNSVSVPLSGAESKNSVCEPASERTVGWGSVCVAQSREGK